MKPTRCYVVAVALVAAIALVLAAAWFGSRRAQTKFAAPDVAMGTAPVDSDAKLALRERAIVLDEAQPRAAAEPTNSAPAQPPIDLFDHESPLATRIAELDRRSRQGDAAAGCQLGFELLRCERAWQTAAHFENVEERVTSFAPRGLQGAQLDARIDAALRRRERHRAVIAACEGVQSRQWAEPARYLHAAAQAGHRPAMRQSLAQALYMPDALVRDPGLVALFRTYAPRYFETLLQEGDPGVLSRWRVAWQQTGDALPDVLPPPYNRPELARAVMRQQLEQAPGWNDRAPGIDTDPPQLRAEAQRLYAERFAPHAARNRAENERLAGFEYGDLSAYECESLAAAQSPRR